MDYTICLVLKDLQLNLRKVVLGEIAAGLSSQCVIEALGLGCSAVQNTLVSQ